MEDHSNPIKPEGTTKVSELDKGKLVQAAAMGELMRSASSVDSITPPKPKRSALSATDAQFAAMMAERTAKEARRGEMEAVNIQMQQRASDQQFELEKLRIEAAERDRAWQRERDLEARRREEEYQRRQDEDRRRQELSQRQVIQLRMSSASNVSHSCLCCLLLVHRVFNCLSRPR